MVTEMKLDSEINEWNNPLRDFSTGYWRNGPFTEYGNHFEVILTEEQVMGVSALMMLGMFKVEKRNEMSDGVPCQ